MDSLNTSVSSEIIRSREYRSIARRITSDNILYKDLLQETAIAVYEMPPSRITQIAGQCADCLKRYVIGIMNMMWSSPRDPFYSMHRRFSATAVGIYISGQEEDDADCIKVSNYKFAKSEDIVESQTLEQAEEKTHPEVYDYQIDEKASMTGQMLEFEKREMKRKGKLPFDYIMFTDYIKLGSFRKVADKYGFSHVTVFNAVKRMREKIRERIRD